MLYTKCSRKNFHARDEDYLSTTHLHIQKIYMCTIYIGSDISRKVIHKWEIFRDLQIGIDSSASFIVVIIQNGIYFYFILFLFFFVLLNSEHVLICKNVLDNFYFYEIKMFFVFTVDFIHFLVCFSPLSVCPVLFFRFPLLLLVSVLDFSVVAA